MGILDKLWKDPNGETKPEQKKEAVQNNTTQQKTSISSISSSSTIMTPVNNGNVMGSVNPEFVEYFRKVFAEANLPGPDFNEFMGALENMKGLNMDESAKYQATYATLIVQGCTKQKLVDSAKIYLEKFAEKRSGFNKAIEGQMSQAVGGRQTEIDSLKKKNDDIDLEIKRLADLKVKNAEQANKLAAELNDESTKLNIKKADFEVTYNDMVGSINDSLDKIQRYINQ